MAKEITFENRDRFIQLGIVIAGIRKARGLSQEMLAKKAHISRALLSQIEAPGIAKSFSLEVLLDISDALQVSPAELLNTTHHPIFK